MRGERKVEDVHGATKCDADAHSEVDYTYEIIGDVQDRISFLMMISIHAPVYGAIRLVFSSLVLQRATQMPIPT